MIPLKKGYLGGIHTKIQKEYIFLHDRKTLFNQSCPPPITTKLHHLFTIKKRFSRYFCAEIE